MSIEKQGRNNIPEWFGFNNRGKIGLNNLRKPKMVDKKHWFGKGVKAVKKC